MNSCGGAVVLYTVLLSVHGGSVTVWELGIVFTVRHAASGLL